MSFSGAACATWRERNASRLAVLDAEHLEDGPVAEVHLERPLRC
jgi:carotenoid cleavage dioxygenase-like enzyme